MAIRGVAELRLKGAMVESPLSRLSLLPVEFAAIALREATLFSVPETWRELKVDCEVILGMRLVKLRLADCVDKVMGVGLDDNLLLGPLDEYVCWKY